MGSTMLRTQAHLSGKGELGCSVVPCTEHSQRSSWFIPKELIYAKGLLLRKKPSLVSLGARY